METVVKKAYEPKDCPNGCSKKYNDAVVEECGFKYVVCRKCDRLLLIASDEPQRITKRKQEHIGYHLF